jgi:hypothetical protein
VFFLRTSLKDPGCKEGRPTLTDVGVTFPTETFVVPRVALVVEPRFVPFTIKGPVGPKSVTLVICCASATEAMTVSANARTYLILKALLLGGCTNRNRTPEPSRPVADGSQ